MRTLKLQQLLMICTNDEYKHKINSDICFWLNSYINAIEIVHIAYIVTIAIVIILCIMTVGDFIRKFNKKNEYASKIAIFVLYLISINILFFFKFICFKKIESFISDDVFKDNPLISTDYATRVKDEISAITLSELKYINGFLFLVFLIYVVAIILTSTLHYTEIKYNNPSSIKSDERFIELKPLSEGLGDSHVTEVVNNSCQ